MVSALGDEFLLLLSAMFSSWNEKIWLYVSSAPKCVFICSVCSIVFSLLILVS